MVGEKKRQIQTKRKQCQLAKVKMAGKINGHLTINRIKNIMNG